MRNLNCDGWDLKDIIIVSFILTMRNLNIFKENRGYIDDIGFILTMRNLNRTPFTCL